MPGIIEEVQAEDPNSRSLGGDPSLASPPIEEQSPAAENTNQASPEEQEGYEKIIGAAGELLYNEKASQKFVEMMKASSEDPATGVAAASKLIIDEIFKQSDGSMPVNLIIPTSGEILAMVGELGTKAGVIEYDEAMNAKAQQKMVEMIMKTYGEGGEDKQAMAMMSEMGPEAGGQMMSEQEAMANG